MTPQALADRLRRAGGPGRQLVAVAGPPASGKSTLAEALAGLLGPRAALVPMDGFHLDNRLLEPRGLLPRKGAPESFDASGFLRLITAIKSGGAHAVPVFDRARDLAIAGAGWVAAEAEWIVVEGNYLLFDAPIWRDLVPLWDSAIWLDVPEAELRRRLIQRWLGHGLDAEAAEARAEANDLPNARLTAQKRLPADIVLSLSSSV